MVDVLLQLEEAKPEGLAETNELTALALKAKKGPEALDALFSSSKFRQLLKGAAVKWGGFARSAGIHIDQEELESDLSFCVMKNIESFQARAKFSTWVYVLAHNYVVSLMRRLSRVEQLDEERPDAYERPGAGIAREVPEGIIFNPAPTPADAWRLGLTYEQVLTLHKAVRELTAEQQQILRLRVEDKKLKEIGELRGMSKSKVDRMLNEIIEVLRCKLSARP
jgi:RNA polymerase sigma factor (sigma-70 family)